MIRLSRAASVPAQSLDEWRRQVLTTLLVATAVVGLPALGSVLVCDASPYLRATYLTCYAIAVGMIAVPKRLHRLRLAGLLTAGYLLLVPSMLNLGLAATIQLLLVALPLIATLLGSRRLGAVTIGLSIAIHAAFTVLAYHGALPAPRPQLGGAEWLTHGLILALLLVMLAVLFERAISFQERLLTEARAASERLAEEAQRRAQLEREVIEATERERRRVGRELHDGLCQQLTAGLLAARLLETDLVDRRAGEAHQAGMIAEVVEGALGEARALSHGLSPGPLGEGGLGVALRELARQVRETVEVECVAEGSGAPSLGGAEALQLYRIAQEATQNAVRHANASRIVLTLTERDGWVRLSVVDDGQGLARDAKPGMGLGSMRARAMALGGSFEVRPAEPAGTEVVCLLPVA
ncbi:MAG: sensor histidine kinase [Myxococcales bacterium]|jgi:signal transduction histidine kinase